MNGNELAQEIAKREKGKKQVGIGQIGEIVGIIADICIETPDTVSTLIGLGKDRERDKGKKGKGKPTPAAATTSEEPEAPADD